MRVISKKEFANLCGKSSAHVSMWLKRGHLVETDGGIDIDHELSKQRIAGEECPGAPKHKVIKPPKKEPIEPNDTGESVAMRKRYLEVKKLEVTIEGERIKNQRISGELVSRELIRRTVFSPIETLFQELLQVFPRSISEILQQDFLGGATVEEGTEKVKQSISAYISRAKKLMVQALPDDED